MCSIEPICGRMYFIKTGLWSKPVSYVLGKFFLSKAPPMLRSEILASDCLSSAYIFAGISVLTPFNTYNVIILSGVLEYSLVFSGKNLAKFSQMGGENLIASIINCFHKQIKI
jgi:hypothetical protein